MESFVAHRVAERARHVVEASRRERFEALADLVQERLIGRVSRARRHDASLITIVGGKVGVVERRKFLKVGGGVGVAGLAGAGVLFARGTKMVPLPAEKLLYFSEREYSIFHAVAETVLVLPEKAPSVEKMQVALHADHHLARLDEDAQRDFHRLLGLFDNALAGLVLTGTTAPFTQLGPEARTAYLEKWARHRLGAIRSGYSALKRLAAASYYGNPETHASLGYNGPPDKDPE